jgi:hypothetical protein
MFQDNGVIRSKRVVVMTNCNIFLILEVHDVLDGDGDNLLFLRLFHLMMLT